jgi:hypothetical protein
MEFRSQKAAERNGFRPRKDNEYGGEVAVVRRAGEEKIVVREPYRAKSKTEWREGGFKVKAGEQPHGQVKTQHGRYDVYRDDQLEPIRKRMISPPQLVPVLAALWATTIGRRCSRLARAESVSAAPARPPMADAMIGPAT